MRRFVFALIASLPATSALADPPQIQAVQATRSGSGYTLSVTLAHPDTGWDHYADGWRVEREDGTVLGTRVLAHPHVEEQPFTRALGNVAVPEGTTVVFVRARCLVDGWRDDRVAVDLR
ncbi:hypothetical protein ACN2XU_08685 [Primorskyibacter sp. 2E107]|uniref:hypothetical protein n=1 Tax=Primorskyibacter sp. 2E107 TaxID=3403458 RepID=UPI003AF5743F